MSVAMRFRGIRVLAFLLVLGIIYIFQPDAWADWLFTVTSVAFAGSLASYFFWSVKGDPARSALGYLMLGRLALIAVSSLAFGLYFLDWRKVTMALDLVWCFVLIFNWVMYRSVVEHIDAVQSEHAVSNWYQETSQSFKLLKTEPLSPENLNVLTKLQETFRYSNRFQCEQSQVLEAQISAEMIALAASAQDRDTFAQKAGEIERLLKQRNLLLAQQLNSKASN